jgi:hypothetical protein
MSPKAPSRPTGMPNFVTLGDCLQVIVSGRGRSGSCSRPGDVLLVAPLAPGTMGFARPGGLSERPMETVLKTVGAVATPSPGVRIPRPPQQQEHALNCVNTACVCAIGGGLAQMLQVPPRILLKAFPWENGSALASAASSATAGC